ncbi:MAG TPA: signal peptide peptidase SppA, partial [Bacteriovoracaceae bacterium]|nr:signal peptide peptidase SppA [Bacteriovoracaceae bacterium]
IGSVEGVLESSSAPIAVIPIDGTIMESKKYVEMLLAAEKSKTVKAIILRIDSPGGAVAPTQEIYEEVRRIDQIKPVYASFANVAASGGYYIGAAARKIYANAGTITGSIGVIMQTADLSQIYEFLKYRTETIKAGRYKDIGNPARPMTDEERDFLQKMVGGTHAQFIDDIVAVRKDRLKKDINELAQGQIFHGNEAKETGLIDEIAGLWEAGRRIHKELELPGEYSLRFMKPARKKFDFSEFLEESGALFKTVRSMLETNAGPAYLYRP